MIEEWRDIQDFEGYYQVSNMGRIRSLDRYVELNGNLARPSKQELSLLIKEKSLLQIGKDYDVSDNAVRKWLKSYELPYKKKDIIRYKLDK